MTEYICDVCADIVAMESDELFDYMVVELDLGFVCNGCCPPLSEDELAAALAEAFADA